MKQVIVALMVLLFSSFPRIAVALQEHWMEVGDVRDKKLPVTLRGVEIDEEPEIFIAETKAQNVPGSFARTSDGCFLEVFLPEGVGSGFVTAKAKAGQNVIRPKPGIEIRNALTEAGRQPLITEINPQGAMPGTEITVTGKNFGAEKDKVIVVLGPSSQQLKPFYLSKEDEGKERLQTLKFTVPDPDKIEGLHIGSSPFKPLQFTVQVMGESGNWKTFNYISRNGRYQLALLATLVTLVIMAPLLSIINKPCFVASLVIVVVSLGFFIHCATTQRGNGFVEPFPIVAAILTTFVLLALFILRKVPEEYRSKFMTLLLDKTTQTVSLSKFQASCWTVVLLFSYVYYSVGQVWFIGQSKMPDFNESLLILLSISYGGLFISKGLSTISPKKELLKKPPSLLDLVQEGGGLSLSRIQLLSFTVMGIVVYIYYLAATDIFVTGLPGIPPTLNTLFGISQGGYLTGKVVGTKVSVNNLFPDKVKCGQAVTVFGKGFSHPTRILIQGIEKPEIADYKDSNTIIFTVPEGCESGKQDLTFVSGGETCIVREAIEVVKSDP